MSSDSSGYNSGGTLDIHLHFPWSSIRTLNSCFTRLQEPLALFLGTLDIHDIIFHYTTVPQQDGCSCGIYTLAGIIAHVQNTAILDFNAGHLYPAAAMICSGA